MRTRSSAALRPELDLGVGGARSDAGSLKCLHAHVAFALARPGYELGERILGGARPALAAGLLHALRDTGPERACDSTRSGRSGRTATAASKPLSREPAAQERLLRQLEVLTDELRRRVGQTFTLEQLAAAYERADVLGARRSVRARRRRPAGRARVAMVQDAAFHLYQRGAVDYTP